MTMGAFRRARLLKHGICVGLIEFELAERPKGTLTHHYSPVGN
jgi:hypothetical protein